MKCTFRTRVAVALFCFSMLGGANADSERALWVSQQIRFVYRSQMTLYECASLREKVARILRALGVHKRTRVRVQSCHISQPLGAGASQLVAMQIDLLSAIPATPKLQAALAQLQSRRELLEQLGATLPPDEEFVAVWRDVDLAANRQLRLGSSHCELLAQLTEQVLPKLAVQVLAKDRFCSPTPHRLRKPTLKVLALMPAPRADDVSTLRRD